jgi:PHP family Zn ribbon phosphoesterase
VFGIEGDACIDCNDASPARQIPWACPACGGVYLLDGAGQG